MNALEIAVEALEFYADQLVHCPGSQARIALEKIAAITTQQHATTPESGARDELRAAFEEYIRGNSDFDASPNALDIGDDGEYCDSFTYNAFVDFKAGAQWQASRHASQVALQPPTEFSIKNESSASVEMSGDGKTLRITDTTHRAAPSDLHAAILSLRPKSFAAPEVNAAYLAGHFDARQAAAALVTNAAPAQNAVGVRVSLLRDAITGPGQLGPCHCPPNECQAPVIMGRQAGCSRAANTKEPK